jgi:hypothetical protein
MAGLERPHHASFPVFKASTINLIANLFFGFESEIQTFSVFAQAQ